MGQSFIFLQCVHVCLLNRLFGLDSKSEPANSHGVVVNTLKKKKIFRLNEASDEYYNQAKTLDEKQETFLPVQGNATTSSRIATIPDLW